MAMFVDKEEQLVTRYLRAGVAGIVSGSPQSTLQTKITFGSNSRSRSRLPRVQSRQLDVAEPRGVYRGRYRGNYSRGYPRGDFRSRGNRGYNRGTSRESARQSGDEYNSRSLRRD